MATPSRQIKSVSTAELYDRWAEVYDTDNNILQAIDDLLIPSLLTLGLKTAHSRLSPNSTAHTLPLTITELGCGTGRNTSKLLLPPFTPPSQTPQIQISTINALDLALKFHTFNALTPTLNPSVLPLFGTADLVMSTLVLEYLPLDVFFRTVRNLLKNEGGVLVLSNMHADLGRRSQAGFMLEEGVKLQGESYVYEVEEVVKEGERWGGRIVGEIGERKVREGDLSLDGVLGGGGGVVDRRRGEKWVGCKVWFGFVMRFIEQESQ